VEKVKLENLTEIRNVYFDDKLTYTLYFGRTRSG
jgi:hypothetical protein